MAKLIKEEITFNKPFTNRLPKGGILKNGGIFIDVQKSTSTTCFCHNTCLFCNILQGTRPVLLSSSKKSFLQL